MIKAVIVDDEPNARELLRRFIQKDLPQVEVLAECRNVDEGLKAVEQFEPDVLFLDVEMPGKNGFALLEAVSNPGFEVIFTTAYENYAIQALRASAMDYLLKPIDMDQLEAAIQRLEEKLKVRNGEQTPEIFQLLQQNLDPSKGIQKLALPNADGMIFLKKSDIIYLRANRSYTQVVTEQLKTIISKPLRFFEDLLPEGYFFRPHRSFIINLKRVHRLVKRDGGYIEMDNGDQVNISSHLREDFISACQKFA